MLTDPAGLSGIDNGTVIWLLVVTCSLIFQLGKNPTTYVEDECEVGGDCWVLLVSELTGASWLYLGLT